MTSTDTNKIKHPPFEKPWHAQIFALVVSLHQAGHFDWDEWSACLGKVSSESDDGSSDFDKWIPALDKLMQEKNILQAGETSIRTKKWHKAADLTPHGKPISLDILTKS